MTYAYDVLLYFRLEIRISVQSEILVVVVFGV